MPFLGHNRHYGNNRESPLEDYLDGLFDLLTFCLHAGGRTCQKNRGPYSSSNPSRAQYIFLHSETDSQVAIVSVGIEVPHYSTVILFGDPCRYKRTLSKSLVG